MLATIFKVSPTDTIGGRATAPPTLTCGATATAFSALVKYPSVPSKTDSTMNVPSFGKMGMDSELVTEE